jgi:hypothetical protein
LPAGHPSGGPFRWPELSPEVKYRGSLIEGVYVFNNDGAPKHDF